MQAGLCPAQNPSVGDNDPSPFLSRHHGEPLGRKYEITSGKNLSNHVYFDQSARNLARSGGPWRLGRDSAGHNLCLRRRGGEQGLRVPGGHLGASEAHIRTGAGRRTATTRQRQGGGGGGGESLTKKDEKGEKGVLLTVC